MTTKQLDKEIKVLIKAIDKDLRDYNNGNTPQGLAYFVAEGLEANGLGGVRIGDVWFSLEEMCF